MIGLSATSYDPSGSVLLNSRIAAPYSARRRGSVTATLDGGVSVYDTGYSDADQTLTAKIFNPSRALLIKLRYLVAYYGQLIASCETGCYLAVAEVTVNGNTALITLRVVSRLSA